MSYQEAQLKVQNRCNRISKLAGFNAPNIIMENELHLLTDAIATMIRLRTVEG
jgi:hypothetical protein